MSTIAVVGFHRSGTSMLTQVLHEAGLFVGDRLLGANPYNPYGHFEDQDVLEFHDKVLQSNQSNWMFDGNATDLWLSADDELWIRAFVGRRNTLHKVWGFKDPRVCLFLRQWDRAIETALYIVLFRDFLETTQSILNRQARDILMEKGSSELHLRFWRTPSLAFRMWVAYNREVVKFAELHGDRIICIRHRQLLSGFPILREVAKRGIELKYVTESKLIDLRITNTVVETLPGLDDPIVEEACNIWHRVEKLTGGSDFDLDARIAKTARSSKGRTFDGRFASLAGTDPRLLREYQGLHKLAFRPPATAP